MYVIHVIFFLYFSSFCLFVLLYSGLFVGFYLLFSKDRERKGMEFDGLGSRRELRGREGGESMIRVYSMKKNLF